MWLVGSRRQDNAPRYLRFTIGPPMALRNLPSKDLKYLICVNLCRREDQRTTDLLHTIMLARRRGYLLKDELERICAWKSPRSIHLIRANSQSQITKASRTALTARSEEDRIQALMCLRGVGIPMASAILMFLDPRRYGVIDIRVWQLLYELGEVTSNRRGVGFTLEQWDQYLTIIRSYSRINKAKARDVEHALFLLHQKYQEGSLYLGDRRNRLCSS